MNQEDQLTCQDFHNEAMELMDDAMYAERDSLPEIAKGYKVQALEKEAQAALMLEDHHTMEPTRGVMFRSAACIANEVGDFEKAKELATKGLEGTSLHQEIKEELEEALKDAEENLD